MQRRVIRALALALACGLAAGCPGHGKGGAATTPVDPATADQAMDAARRAVEQWRQAYEVDSFDALSPLYAHDKGLVVVQQGVPFVGWDAVEVHLEDLLGHAREIHVRLKDVRVLAMTDSAVVVALMDRDVSDGVTTVSESGVLTLVLRHQGDGWLVVAEHYSHPPQAS
jgi:ketosteroid isomerase-like protein